MSTNWYRPDVIAQDLTPAPFAAWDDLIGAVASTTQNYLLELACLIARSGLDPGAPTAPRSDTTIFAEQMVVDVASLTTDVRTAGLVELGTGAPTFLLAVWIEDMMIRADVAWRAMFREEWRPIPTPTQTDPGRPTSDSFSPWPSCLPSTQSPRSWSGCAGPEPTLAGFVNQDGT